jgi:hypothetical protein
MDPFKLMVLKLADDPSVGNAEMMAIWNARKPDGLRRHSDGLKPLLIEASYAAALATGATATSIDIPAVRRVSRWLLDLPAPQFPFPVNRELAARGKVIFYQQCAECHAFGSSSVEKVIPLAEIGTDPSRA